MFKQIGVNFTPALGFVNRTAMRQYVGTLAHLTSHRHTDPNTLQLGTNVEVITDLHNVLESRGNDVFVSARSRHRRPADTPSDQSFENLPLPFFLPRNMPGLTGIRWTNVNVGSRTFNGRLLSAGADVTCCRFYDGDAVMIRPTLFFRPSTLFEIAVGHEANAIDPPTGAVDIDLATTNAVVDLTPDMQVALQAQDDNISENFALSTRYRWEYRPGKDELFGGLGQSALIADRGFIGQTTQATIRLDTLPVLSSVPD